MVAVLKLLALCTARQDSFKKNKEVRIRNNLAGFAFGVWGAVQVYNGP